MTASQSFVVSWGQFTVAALAILVAARAALAWIKQPVDRIRLIQICALAVLAMPILLASSLGTVARLEVFDAPRPSPSETLADDVPRAPAMANNSPTWPATSFVADSTQSSHPGDASDSSVNSAAPPPLLSVLAELQPTTTRPAPAASDTWTWAAITIGLFHALAALFFLAEWTFAEIRLRQLVRSATSVPPHVLTFWQSISKNRGGSVRLLLSPTIDTPLTFGWLHPVVLIPNNLAWSAGEPLRFCLAHEWCHIERSDFLSWQVLRACRFLTWFQPLYWKLQRELRVCQDMIADRQSTADQVAAVAYSELLVNFARNRQFPAAQGALAMFDHPSQLMRRVTMLLVGPIALRSHCSWKFSLAAGGLAAVACLLVSGVRLDAARHDQHDHQQPNQGSPLQEKPEPASEKFTTPSEQPKEKAEPPSTERKTENKTEPPAPEDQPALLTYHCTVRDKDTGLAVPNATVTVERLDSSSNHWPYKQIAKTTHVTDADGKFTVEIPPEQSANPLLYIQVYAEHENYVRIPGIGYSLSMIRKNESIGERPFFENLQLQPADIVTGKLVSPAGEPLAGVKVFGFTSPKTRGPNNIRWLDARTAPDGSFKVNAMKGGVAFVWLMPDNYSIVQRSVNSGPTDLGELRAVPGIRLRGRTLAADGKPLAGIAVNVIYQGRDEALQTYSVLTGIRRGAVSDADGNFTIDPLPPGEYRIAADEQLIDPRLERDLHPLPAVFLAKKTTLKEGLDPGEIVLQAVPHINFHAQYLDSQGKKRQGHEFHINGRLDSEFWSTRARPDNDGSVEVRLPHGLQNVRVGLITNEHSALRHRKGPGKPIENNNFEIDLGTLNDDFEGFEIIRYKAPIALIQAVDAEGLPLKKFSVTAKYPWGEQRYILAGEQRSDISFSQQKDGRYRTEQMLPDEEVTFTAKAEGYESAFETVKLAEGETKNVVIKLKTVSAAADAGKLTAGGDAKLLEKTKPDAPVNKE